MHSRSQWCPLLQRLPSVTDASLLEGDCQMVPVGVLYMLNCRLFCIQVSTADNKGQVHAIPLFLVHVSEADRDFIKQLHFTQSLFDRSSILPKALPTTGWAYLRLKPTYTLPRWRRDRRGSISMHLIHQRLQLLVVCQQSASMSQFVLSFSSSSSAERREI